MVTNSSSDSTMLQKNANVFSASKKVRGNHLKKYYCSLMNRSLSVSLPLRNWHFPLVIPLFTDDTVLDDFDFGEDISDSELKEKFKRELVSFSPYFDFVLYVITFIITQVML